MRPDPATLAWVAHLDVDLESAQAALRLPPGTRPAPPGGSPVPEPREEWYPGELAGEPLSGDAASLPVAAAPKEATLSSTKPLRGAYARRARGGQ